MSMGTRYEVDREDLLKFAAEVRDMAHHAANCAPLHGGDPCDFVMKIKLDSLVDQFTQFRDPMRSSSLLVLRERESQRDRYSDEHDDEMTGGELALAAACYASPREIFEREVHWTGTVYRNPFPWDDIERDDRKRKSNGFLQEKRTSKDNLDLLVKAGALILAEIDRIQRASKKEAEEKSG